MILLSVLLIIILLFSFIIFHSEKSLKDIHGRTIESFQDNNDQNMNENQNITKEDLFSKKNIDNDISQKDRQCADLLIQKNGFYYLYNTRMIEIPGVNPIRLENLDEYNEFVKWQRHQGFNCPILFVQYLYDSQGNLQKKIRKDPFDLQGGLPPSIVQNKAQITNDYKDIKNLLTTGEDAGQETIKMERLRREPIKADQQKSKFEPHAFDPNNQSIGVKTELDSMYAKDDL